LFLEHTRTLKEDDSKYGVRILHDASRSSRHLVSQQPSHVAARGMDAADRLWPC